jgi:hypothetical protein
LDYYEPEMLDDTQYPPISAEDRKAAETEIKRRTVRRRKTENKDRVSRVPIALELSSDGEKTKTKRRTK